MKNSKIGKIHKQYNCVLKEPYGSYKKKKMTIVDKWILYRIHGGQ